MSLLLYIGALTILLAAGLHPLRAAEACADCHPKQVAAYRKTGMGRSIGRPAAQASGSFLHASSGTFFSVTATAAGQVHRLRRDGLEEEFPISHTIGSGNAAVGYLIRLGDRLYQSSLAYYSATARFGMAPGMEDLADPDFLRPAGAECMWCHSGQSNPIPHSLNQYDDPPLSVEAISCERCHGPTAAHLAQPVRETILNPAELSPLQRDSICEQCHLGGVQRVLNPGRAFADFQPGMALEEVLTVYVPEDGAAEYKVVSHVEQLALSRCFRESEREMWCGTCHDPHDASDDARAGYIRKCQSCHADAALQGHGAPSHDCVSCHMQRRQSRDSGHSAFTDHRISITSSASVVTTSQPGANLRAWREPAKRLRSRNLGIAYAREAEASGSKQQLERALDLLGSAVRRFPDDADALGGLGMALLLSGAEEQGLEKLEHAVAAEPANPLRYPPVAAALWQRGDDVKAVATLRAAIDADPYYAPAYRLLAHILVEQGRHDEARAAWESYLQRVPQSVNARLTLRAIPNGSR